MGGNKATYLGIGIGGVGDSDFEGIIPDPDNYGGKINQIATPHGRSKGRTDALTEEEEEQSILRSEFRN